jgi:hypothetical protein
VLMPHLLEEANSLCEHVVLRGDEWKPQPNAVMLLLGFRARWREE